MQLPTIELAGKIVKYRPLSEQGAPLNRQCMPKQSNQKEIKKSNAKEM